MGHKHDYLERLRLWFIPKLGGLARLAEELTGDDYYVTGKLHNRQFVGRVPLDEESFEEKLHEMGFDRNPLSSLKSYAGKEEEGSWRKVGYDEYPGMQLHVVLYGGESIEKGDQGYTYVYAHWEKRWDTDPVGHYRGVDKDDDEGVRRVKRLFDENGVEHEPIRP